MLEKGDRVRMTEVFKRRMRGVCGIAGKHIGPFDGDEGEDCEGCSSAHVDEFGDCTGIVQGPMDFNNCKPADPEYDRSKLGPEVDVRWQPSKLRYGYSPEDLELVSYDAR